MGPAAFSQENPFIGTWVLNAEKSAFAAEAPLDSLTLVVSDAGGGKLKSVSDLSMSGFAIHGELTFAVDGQDYESVVTPAPPAGTTITTSYTRVSEKIYEISNKLNGQVISTGHYEVSEDGKTLTVSTTGTGPATGVNSTAVLDRK
jgi:hypothetical protein